MRSAATTGQGAAMLRHLAQEVVLVQFPPVLGVSRTPLAAAASHMLGVAFRALIVSVEPQVSMSEDDLVALSAPYLG